MQDELRYLKIGEGPYFALYRPYHLASIETPLSIASAALERQATIAPVGPPVAEVIAIAKRALRRGERLGLPGEDTVYGLIDTRDRALEGGLLPLGLASNAELRVDVAADEPLRWSDVTVEENLLTSLRTEQDRDRDVPRRRERH